MTVSMNERFCLLSLELQFPSPSLFLFHNEFLEQKRCLRDFHCVRIFDEIRILVPECQDAAGLAAHNQITVFDEIIKLPDVKVRVFASCFSETGCLGGAA